MLSRSLLLALFAALAAAVPPGSAAEGWTRYWPSGTYWSACARRGARAVKAIVHDDTVRIVPGKACRIVGEPLIRGVAKDVALKIGGSTRIGDGDDTNDFTDVITSLDPVGDPHYHTNLTIELPPNLPLELEADGGTVTLSGVALPHFAIKTRSGSVILENVINAGRSSVQTESGEIRIASGAGALGRIRTTITGKGRLSGKVPLKPRSAGTLEIATENGTITVAPDTSWQHHLR